MAEGLRTILLEIFSRIDVTAELLEDLMPAEVSRTHHFGLTDESPIYFRPRRLSPLLNSPVLAEIFNMLPADIVKASVLVMAFPIVVITKRDGKPPMCVDYRQLNARMKLDRFPLSKMEELLKDLNGCSFFTTLNLFSATGKFRYPRRWEIWQPSRASSARTDSMICLSV